MPDTMPTALHQRLADRGVTLLLPDTIEIGGEIDPGRISGDGVVIHPGCRLRGAGTVIGPGCQLGAEAPMTLDGCALGARVQLKGGYAAGSVFLDDSSLGSSAQVREACLLEEESGAAHACGLKQTILFPYAQLGSLINFCDALLAGGTSRHDHSEVGSGYIHFNFTPRGDKATASLFGDVPRGVFLRQPRIFLGGQGGAVGPVRVGFGTVVAAGLILHEDVPDGTWRTDAEPLVPDASDAHLRRVVANDIAYLGQIAALRLWYDAVRRPYLAATPLGALVLEAALRTLDAARAERVKRLRELAGVITPKTPARRQFQERAAAVTDAILACQPRLDEPVVAALTAGAAQPGTTYLAAVKALPDEAVAAGVAWLSGVVEDIRRAALAPIPGLDLPA